MKNQLNGDCETLLWRSVIYGVLSLTLHPPTSKTLGVLRREETRRSILEAASFLESKGWLAEPRGEAALADERLDLVARAGSWVEIFPFLTLDWFHSAHGHLFGHTARGAVSPYETEYGPEGLFQQPHQLASLTGFYRAFGLRVRQTERERPDHISCELEFLEFLLRKETYAVDQGDDPMREATSRAERLFLQDHLGRFARAFGRCLKKYDPESFFGKAGDLLFDFVTLECDHLGIEAGPSHMPLRLAAEDRVPMACGGESELIQLET